jgi:rod shape-determining protein MreC
MAIQNDSDVYFRRIVRRVLVSVLLIVTFLTFLIWRIDNPRAERFRMAVIDKVIPPLESVLAPVAHFSNMISDAQSYSRIYMQNQELRRELQQMKAWKEAAIQLEQKNAKLLDLNNVKLNPKLTFTTGVVLTDSGSPFRQSALINIGRNDGIVDGWAAMDGLGLVGRISGVGKNSARVLFLTDRSSRIPVEVTPSGQKAILTGDNTPLPPLEFIDSVDQIRAGDRVITTGDGGVFPPGLLTGTVFLSSDGRLRVRLAADYRRLEFLRVIRHLPASPISEPGRLVGQNLPDEISVSE